MQRITSFEIRGLFGTKDISLPVQDNTLIIVGPNGIGKSSVANLFYFLMSRQWSRMLDYNFLSISVSFGETVISATREDIGGLSALKQLADDPNFSPRARHRINRLIEENVLERYISTERFTPADRRFYSEIMEIPTVEVPMFHRMLTRRASLSEDMAIVPRAQLDKQISAQLHSRVLYMPTYRRIEKDLRDIFPDFEERYRARTGAEVSLSAGRSSGHYTELVSFGMEDVRSALRDRTQEIRNYSLSQFNDLSALYLRDVIRGTADEYIATQINSLNDDKINSILDRVSESTLSSSDKILLKEKVRAIQGKRKTEVDIHDRYLAHYFSRLVKVNNEIAGLEVDISAFVEVCNSYLRPSKRMIYDELTFAVKIVDSAGVEIDLSMLSSGEKQVVAIFAHLYLEGAQDLVVVIDEPELSLSVPWQKRFLVDIKGSGRCGCLVAVTHSPFIYDNELRQNSIDLRRRTIPTGDS